MNEHYRDRVVALFAIALLALNYPLLAGVDRVLWVLGIPLLYLYLFLVWLLVIAALAVLVGRED